MLKSLFSLPTRAILNVRLYLAAQRTLKRLRALGKPFDDLDVGYAMAPDLVKIFGVQKVKKGLIVKMAMGQLTKTDVGVGRYITEHHKVSA